MRNRHFGRRRFVTLLSGGAALLVAACGGAPPTAAPSKPTEVPKPAAADPTKPAAAAPAATSAPVAAATTAPGGAAATKPAEKPAAAAPAATTAPVATKPVAAGKTGVEFWFNQPFQAKEFEAVIDQFHKQNDKLQVQISLVPQTEIATKLTTAIAGGAPPDAARLGGPVLNLLFIDNKHAADLNQFDPQVATYDFLKPAKDTLIKDGKLYALPVNSGAHVFVYNQDLYKASGLDPAKPPETIDQIMEYATKVAKPDQQIAGHYVLTAPTAQTGSDHFFAYLWNFGGREVSPDGTTITWNSPEGVQAAQFFADLVKNKLMPVKKVDEAQSVTDYVTGKVGSMGSFPSTLGQIEKAPFKSSSVVFPKAKQQVSPVGFGTIMVFEKGKNKAGGWEVAKFCALNAEANTLWNTTFGQLPARLSYRDTPAWQKHEKEHPILGAFLEAQKSAQTSYFGPGATPAFVELGKAIEAIVYGQAQPKAALDDSAQKAQAILDRERKKSA
jgi:ABC-type glycerol-3-phosphate transport system substrate-binding protein